MIARPRATFAVLSVAVPFAASLGIAACGSGRVAADVNWSAEQEKQNRPLRDTEYLGQPPPDKDIADGGPVALLGVRHDLMIAPTTKKQANCNCLAVEVGEVGDTKFQWLNGAPDLRGDAAVVAISAKGIGPCAGGEADEAQRRASISAVDRDGADVWIEIEELPDGRPLASGAIVPRPGAGGHVFVRPRTARVPYARPQAGVPCKVR